MSIYDLSMFRMHPKADEHFVVQGDKYRITVLTEQLLRLEYSEDGVFEDRATRLAFNRAFDTPQYQVYRQNGLLHVVTRHLHLEYDEKPFSTIGLQIFMDGTQDWHYGAKAQTLYGTCRTLDQANGAVPLEEGLLSKWPGFSVVDDSRTIAIGEDGWPVPVRNKRTDIYFFGYHLDFEKCIQDFYKLSAPVPLLPRQVLGNWWSRYHKYSDQEYLELMDAFAKRDVPLSVAVIDMDWHLTETPDPVKYGGGWTGYTWNKAYFPDPEAFLQELEKRNMKKLLNLHPRDGIRGFEEVYPAMCRRLGLDPEQERPIEFDVSSRAYMEAYFDTVLNPMEAEGVDYWWLDWQQEGGSHVEGYDTLWMLNHCHYVDSARTGKRPMTFSRYAGIGSHRYPIGFSGDTHVTWESLDFQPYFTATAANVGFSWWSHDIGGHMLGYMDDELQTRWVQLGVFSPIMRLHSTNNIFNTKEPWNYGDCEGVISDFLRLRHRLVPYLYTMVYRNTEEGIPLVRPMYHVYSGDENAYTVPNQYCFGSQLIVAPITSPRDKGSLMSKTTAWLPEGMYVDFFSGRVYRGGRKLEVYRNLAMMPVFAKAGAIVPMAVPEGNSVGNPAVLELAVFGGADGSFTLVEDNDRCGDENVVARTEYTFRFGAESCLSFTQQPVPNVPVRDYVLRFVAFTMPEGLRAQVNGEERQLEYHYELASRTVTARLSGITAGDRVRITMTGDGKLPDNEVLRTAFDMLNRAQISYEDKDSLYRVASSDAPVYVKVQDILSRDANASVKGALIELLCANG